MIAKLRIIKIFFWGTFGEGFILTEQEGFASRLFAALCVKPPLSFGKTVFKASSIQLISISSRNVPDTGILPDIKLSKPKVYRVDC